MNYFIENWYLIIVFVAIVVVAVVGICALFKLPPEEQLNKVREWLLWAVTEAEKELGSGTGQLKLRKVYDLFVVRFPWLAKFISFNRFSDLVDEVLVDMRDLIAKNVAVQDYVGIKETA